MICSRLLRLGILLLVSAMVPLLTVGCGRDEPPAVDVDQYKEAKQRHDTIRAKEYGRSSVEDPRAQGGGRGRGGR